MNDKITKIVAIVALVVALGVAIFKGGNNEQVLNLVQSLQNQIQNLPSSTEILGAIGTRMPNGIAIGTNEVAKTGTFRISNTGTSIARENFGLCQISGTTAQATFGGFQDKFLNCGGGTLGTTALIGVTAGDNVRVTFGTTTATAQNSILIIGANASSTSGFITLHLLNASSTVITLAANATTSLQYSAATSTVTN